MEYRQTHPLSTGNAVHVISFNPSTRFYEDLFAREGNGGGFLTIAGTATWAGVRGSCRAAVYSSSSDSEGEDDNGESEGESNGFAAWYRASSASVTTKMPFG